MTNSQALITVTSESESRTDLLDLETAYRGEGFVVFKAYREDGASVSFSVAEEELRALLTELGILTAEGK